MELDNCILESVLNKATIPKTGVFYNFHIPLIVLLTHLILILIDFDRTINLQYLFLEQAQFLWVQSCTQVPLVVK